jgi:EpsI family protein
VSDGALTVPLSPEAVTVREMRVQSVLGEQLAAYWFDVGGAITANPVTAKIMEVRRQFSDKPATPALVAVSIATRGLDRPQEYLQQLVSRLVVMSRPCADGMRRQGRACADAPRAIGAITSDRG